MRSVIPFNHGWLFAPRELSPSAPDSDFQRVTLPHTNIELPHHSFNNLDYQFTSTYRQRFTLPEPLKGRRLYLDFDGAMTAYTVTVNGFTLGTFDGGYTPSSFDLTDALRDGENLLQVSLDSSERPDIPPNGGLVDYLTFGGIYREVSLRYVEPVHIQDVFARTLDVLSGEPVAEIDVTVRNLSDRAASVDVAISIGDMESGSVKAQVPANDHIVVTLTLSSAQFALWSPDSPTLYTCITALSTSGILLDRVHTRFGFRHAVFAEDGFYLNGQKLKLIGLNRHQTYPYIGAAAPARLQRKDADILKSELGINIVRTSHYPQSPHFLNRCDEIGLLVFEEIPGWQFIGDEDWKALSLMTVEQMILRDRNHPSIVLWGVRINESFDDDALYTATNALAHKLDPTRQTGGVRYFQGSSFLEDVFTYNDFSNTIIEPNHTPYMVTEYNGHMFPTKTFDNEERQVEHALRHAHIVDKNFEWQQIAGAIGWCAFDYNTHREFGSGDRICYHGVSDTFRLPKFAAAVYASQVDPTVRPVLDVASFWTQGDRSASGVNPLHIFTNCDAVQVYKGERLYGTYTPDREAFPSMPHPPVNVSGISGLAMFGPNYENLRVVGLLNNQPVIEQRMSSRGVPFALTLTADDQTIHADGADMTRIIFKIVDEFGNRMPFCTQVVSFDIEGEGVLVGENPFPLVGGQAAIYVRASETSGTILIRATTRGLAPAEVTIEAV